MPRKPSELNALAVSRLAKPGLHFVGGVPGLALQVLPSGGRTWVLRMVIGSKRRDMGLGGYPGVTLAQARESARSARARVREGIDPIEEAKAARSALKAAQAAAMTFEQCAAAYIAANRAAWRNAKHVQQWENTLATWAGPKIGRLLVRDVGLPQVLAVLEQPADADKPDGPSLWHGKTETASRVRGRIESVLNWATVRGYRQGDNPARWRGHLDKLLPAPGKVAKEAHFPALPVAQAGAFMAALRMQRGTGARALEFGIYTCTRSQEIRGALWREFDLDGAVWVIPADRMKAKTEHRVPLSEPALSILRRQYEASGYSDSHKPRGDELVFVAPREGMLSNSTLNAVIDRMNEPEPKWVDPKDGRTVVQHGFRSTFRDWAAERTNYPRDAAEMALAHTISDKVEAAYRRGDLFEKRRLMMVEWADFLAQPERPADVVSIGTARRGAVATLPPTDTVPDAPAGIPAPQSAAR